IPPLLALLLAFLTRNVILSLFLGVLNGAWMIALVNQGDILNAVGGAFFISIDCFVGILADHRDAGIIMQVLVIGALIALITRLGGMKGIANLITKVAKGPRSTQVAIWLCSWIIFFDDYANSLIIGPIMRPACDKFRVSREKLAYIVDSTAAPVAGIMIISTWIGTELVNINQGLSIAGITGVTAYGMFIDTIPYRFYNILTLFFVLASGFLLRDFGPMLKAEIRARTTGKTQNPETLAEVADDSASLDEEKEEVKEDYAILTATSKIPKPNIWNAIIPIFVLSVSGVLLFYTNGASYVEGIADMPFWDGVREAYSKADVSLVLFQAGLFSCIIAILMGFFEKIFTIRDGIETWAHGMKSMVFVCIILVLAWSIGSIIGKLGTARFLSGALEGAMPMWILPMLIFIIAGLISFATGTSYGTMAILMPIVIPFAAVSADFGSGGELAVTSAIYTFIIICSSAVLTGAIFGDHCSPISDSPILSSMGAGCALLDHVTTQIWYAVVVAGAVIIGYILVGLGLNVWLTLLTTAVLLVLFLLFVAKKVPAYEGDKKVSVSEKTSE
ncbi:MAG TPA: Na+/H+ antiporter NhaC family protein, partial [Methanocorpusculum sp.]|nr:Na+/H+ antiporter NhaC family protein [Methanocorpusculum sp.]